MRQNLSALKEKQRLPISAPTVGTRESCIFLFSILTGICWSTPTPQWRVRTSWISKTSTENLSSAESSPPQQLHLPNQKAGITINGLFQAEFFRGGRVLMCNW